MAVIGMLESDVGDAVQPCTGSPHAAIGSAGRRSPWSHDMVHARVRWIVTIFSDLTAAALQALPVPPTASPAREGHHADSEPPWADLGRPSRSVPAARA